MSLQPPDNPAGEYVAEPNPTADRLRERIAEIGQLPRYVRKLVAGLSAEQLDTKYKNWTIRQIVHHLADSHINAYVRTKLTLTEDCPTIKPYDETEWSRLPDAREMDVDVSLSLLDAVHARWEYALTHGSAADFERAYFHPEYKKTFRLAEVVGLYAWHGKHHAEMIAWMRRESGW